MASDAPAQNLFVANSEGNNIVEITPGGAGSIFASGLDQPVALAFNSAGDLFVANRLGGTITEITPGGGQSTFASGLSCPRALAFNSAGDLFVAGLGSNSGASKSRRTEA
jgi:DNA-binding beta-propeller fold protein YncE